MLQKISKEKLLLSYSLCRMKIGKLANTSFESQSDKEINICILNKKNNMKNVKNKTISLTFFV